METTDLGKAGSKPDDRLGVVSLAAAHSIESFIATAKKHQIWDREKLVNPPR